MVSQSLSASGRTDFAAKPLNPLCEGREVRAVEEDGVLKVFVLCQDATPMSARFATEYMCDYFRPLDHASLRDKRGHSRHRDVRESLAAK